MDINSLQYVEALYRHRSFIKAAEEIPMTTQGLRKAIRALEDELGITIYTSSKDGLQFTRAGKYLLEFGRKTTSEYGRLLSELQKLRLEERRTVSAGFSVATFGVFAPGIAEWLKTAEDTQSFHYETFSEEDILSGVKNGRFDFAFTWGRPDGRIYRYDHLTNIPLLAILNRRHRLAEKAELSLQDLQGEHIIFFSNLHKPHQMICERCREEGIVLDFSYITPETMVMLTYLRNNLGIGFILPNEIELYDSRRFCARPIVGVSFPLGITMLETHVPSPEEERFIRLLAVAAKRAGSPGSVRHNGI